jgi:hypothetical protein
MATYAPSGFAVNAFLCDSAVVAEGKVYVQGGGWNILNSPQFPFVRDRVGIAAVISVPYIATNTMHNLNIWLEDQDGKHHPLGFAVGPDGQPEQQMKLVARFAQGRPIGLRAGDPQNLPFAVNLDNVLVETPGAYAFVLTIGEEEMARLSFNAVNPHGFAMGTSG